MTFFSSPRSPPVTPRNDVAVELGRIPLPHTFPGARKGAENVPVLKPWQTQRNTETFVARFNSLSMQPTLQDVLAEIHGLRAENRAEIHGLRAENRAEIHGFRAEIRAEIHALRAEVHQLVQRSPQSWFSPPQLGSARPALGRWHIQPIAK